MIKNQTVKLSQSHTLLSAGLHFGKVRCLREIGGLILAEAEYPVGFATPLHAHETASLTMVKYGGYQEQFDARTYKCVRGTVLYRAAGEAHYDQVDTTGARCLMIEFNETWRDRLSAFNVPATRQLANADTFVRQISSELSKNDSATPLAVESLVLELICRIVRQAPPARTVPAWLKGLRDRLETDYTQSLSLSEVARDAGRHPAHVARMFRQHYHCSIGDFVRQRRITHACERIRAGETFSTIAIDCGFAHQAHFSRVFRDTIGLTPREYRDVSRKARTKAHRM